MDFEGLGKETAIIRELHVYGELQAVGEKSDSATQHSWLWKKLLKTAENIAKKKDLPQFPWFHESEWENITKNKDLSLKEVIWKNP